MPDIILPDGSVFRYDDSQGVWRHIPDVDTANAMGVDWNNLYAYDSLPGPQGDDWPSVDSQSPPPPPSAPPPPQGSPPPVGQTSSAPTVALQAGDGSTYLQETTGGLAGSQASLRQYIAGTDGNWHWIPDPQTAAAYRINLNATTWYGDESSFPGGIGDPIVSAVASSSGGGSGDTGGDVSLTTSFVQETGGDPDTFTIPGTYAGELTASGAFDSFVHVLNYEGPSGVTSAQAYADQLVQAAS